MAATTIALLGTLRELHSEVPGYSLESLASLVAAKNPDLLCVEIDHRDWEAGNLAQGAMEVGEALAPPTLRTDIVLVPIGADGRLWEESGVPAASKGLFALARRWACRFLDQVIVKLVKLANSPRAINSQLFEHLCGGICSLQVFLTDRESRREWVTKNESLLDEIRWTICRDPGRRILVALDCRRKHWLSPRLRIVPGVSLVRFRDF